MEYPFDITKSDDYENVICEMTDRWLEDKGIDISLLNKYFDGYSSFDGMSNGVMELSYSYYFRPKYESIESVCGGHLSIICDVFGGSENLGKKVIQNGIEMKVGTTSYEKPQKNGQRWIGVSFWTTTDKIDKSWIGGFGKVKNSKEVK